GGLADAPTVTGLASAGGFKIPWTAPGTPDSYGPPTTVGTASKMKIGGGGGPATPAGDDVVDEDQRAESEHERRERDEQVPVGELLRVLGDAARHSLDPDQVHRGEGQVEEDERRPEVPLA